MLSKVREIAPKYGIDPLVALAVAEVESNGSGYDSDGLLKCLYEPHIMFRLTRDHNKRSMLSKMGLACQRWGQIPYAPTNKANWARIAKAAEIVGKEMALRAASFGKYQIMGFNYDRAGFSSATDMVNAFLESEEAQDEAFFRFVTSDEEMLKALQHKQWAEFAKRYNGPGYRKNKYDTRMSKAYKRISRTGYSLEEGKRIQRELNKLGYNLVVDGIVGPKTKQAMQMAGMLA